jgi:hypothetical protein
MNRQELALKLDSIDPDWPHKFLSTDAAARFYREELEFAQKPGFVVHSSPWEPPTVIDAIYEDPEE